MKCASEKLLHYLSPAKIIVARYSTSFGNRGKFFGIRLRIINTEKCINTITMFY